MKLSLRPESMSCAEWEPSSEGHDAEEQDDGGGQQGGQLLGSLAGVALDGRQVARDEDHGEERDNEDDNDPVDVHNVLNESAPEVVHVVGDPVADESVAESLDTIERELEDCGSHHKEQGAPAWRTLAEGERSHQDRKVNEAVCLFASPGSADQCQTVGFSTL